MPNGIGHHWTNIDKGLGVMRQAADAAKHIAAHALNQYTFQVVTGEGNNKRQVALMTLAVKPESVETILPSRTVVTQTVGGAFLDSFGLGLAKIRISGTTGRKSRMVGTSALSGLEQIRFLRDEIFRQSHDPSFSAPGQPPRPDPTQEGDIYTVYFYDWQMDEAYVVNIDSLRIRRSLDRNHLYAYTIEMTVLDRLDKNDVPTLDPLFNLLKITRREGVRQFVSGFREVLSRMQVPDAFLEEIGRQKMGIIP